MSFKKAFKNCQRTCLFDSGLCALQLRKSNPVTFPLETEPAAYEKNTWSPYFRPPQAMETVKYQKLCILSNFLRINWKLFSFLCFLSKYALINLIGGFYFSSFYYLFFLLIFLKLFFKIYLAKMRESFKVRINSYLKASYIFFFVFEQKTAMRKEEIPTYR